LVVDLGRRLRRNLGSQAGGQAGGRTCDRAGNGRTAGDPHLCFFLFARWKSCAAPTAVMLEGLPIELVGQILGLLAEMSLMNNHGMVLQIALIGSIGYAAVVPVLYRTVKMNESNSKAVEFMFSEDATPFTSGLLQPPPAVRLCPHVRRIFVKTNSSFPNFRLLSNLETVATVSGNRSILPQKDFPKLARSLAHYVSLTVVHPEELPPTVTHASFYIHLWEASALGIFQAYAQATFRDTLTHIAIELNEAIHYNYEQQLIKLLSFLISRPTTVLVVLRVYRAASRPKSVAAVARAIWKLAGNARQRIMLWRDQRRIDTVADDITTSLRDIMEGRMPWTEGQPLSDHDLDDEKQWLEGEKQDSEESSSREDDTGIEAMAGTVSQLP